MALCGKCLNKVESTGYCKLCVRIDPDALNLFLHELHSQVKALSHCSDMVNEMFSKLKCAQHISGEDEKING